MGSDVVEIGKLLARQQEDDRAASRWHRARLQNLLREREVPRGLDVPFMSELGRDEARRLIRCLECQPMRKRAVR